MKLLLAFLPSLLLAQVTATFKPLPIAGTSKVFGSGKEIGLWTVAVCNESDAPVIRARERVMRKAPAIHELPNTLTQDVLRRRASASGRATAVEVLSGVSGLAGAGMAAVGVAQKSKAVSYVGAGLQVIALVITLVKKRVPDPQPYLGDLLPDTIALSADACHTWLVGSGLVPRDLLRTIGPVVVE